MGDIIDFRQNLEFLLQQCFDKFRDLRRKTHQFPEGSVGHEKIKEEFQSTVEKRNHILKILEWYDNGVR